MKMLLYCCGFNGFGQLKNTEDTFLEVLTLMPVENAFEVAFSWSNLFVRTTAGEVFALGQVKEESKATIQFTFEDDLNADRQTKNIKNISCSFFNKKALFVTEEGDCYRIDGDVAPYVKRLHDFTRVESDDLEEYDMENKVVKVCCGGFTNLALLSSRDKLYCIPSKVPLGGIKVQEIACGFEHNLVMTDNGEVYSWGGGSRGQLGLSTLENTEAPTRVELPPVTHIAAGGWHCFARTAENRLFTWGWNSHGQLGFPTAKNEKEENIVNVAADPICVPFTTVEPLTGLACGSKHTILVFAHKSAWGCGWNAYGQLGMCASDRPTCEQLTELAVPSGTIRGVFAGGWNTGLLIEQEDNV